jgi:hypothetical protein
MQTKDPLKQDKARLAMSACTSKAHRSIKCTGNIVVNQEQYAIS